MMALKSHLLSSQYPQGNHKANVQLQAASMLHINYGSSLRPSIMGYDAFYSFSEIFSLAAASEMQFMNLIDTKLDKFTRRGIHQGDSLPNLKYLSLILYRHIQHIQGVFDAFENTNHPKWPKASKDQGKKAKVSRDGLLRDYKCLHLRANALHSRCNSEIGVLMNSISIEESQKAMMQAERVGKLTFLASIFVPLSFTTSVFGMNVRELDQGSLSMWVWAAMSVPLFILTLVLFQSNYDFGRAGKQSYEAISNFLRRFCL